MFQACTPPLIYDTYTLFSIYFPLSKSWQGRWIYIRRQGLFSDGWLFMVLMYPGLVGEWGEGTGMALLEKPGLRERVLGVGDWD